MGYDLTRDGCSVEHQGWTLDCCETASTLPDSVDGGTIRLAGAVEQAYAETL